MATGLVTGTWQILTSYRIITPLIDCQEFVTDAYVGNPYVCQIWCKSIHRVAFMQVGETKTTKIFIYLYIPFSKASL